MQHFHFGTKDLVHKRDSNLNLPFMGTTPHYLVARYANEDGSSFFFFFGKSTWLEIHSKVFIFVLDMEIWA
jgi:hypothetical protein